MENKSKYIHLPTTWIVDSPNKQLTDRNTESYILDGLKTNPYVNNTQTVFN